MNNLGQFKAGESGNKRGRPKGARSQRNQLLDEMMAENDHARSIIQKLIESALAGDTQAANLLLSRYQPPYRQTHKPIEFKLSPDSTPLERCNELLDAVAGGYLPADVGTLLINAVTALCRVAEVKEIEQRLALLEAYNE
jgi:hypothetical protein